MGQEDQANVIITSYDYIGTGVHECLRLITGSYACTLLKEFKYLDSLSKLARTWR